MPHACIEEGFLAVWQDIPYLVPSLQELVRGTYSTVKLGHDFRPGQDGVQGGALIALKTFDFHDKNLMATRILLGIIENELNIHQGVESPHICRPLGHGRLHARFDPSPSKWIADRRRYCLCCSRGNDRRSAGESVPGVPQGGRLGGHAAS